MPAIVPITSKEGGVALLQTGRWVIKQEFSCEGHHIILPQSDSYIQSFERMWEKTAEEYQSLPADWKPHFFATPLFSDLLEKGEAHCFTHNGRVKYSVHTLPNYGLAVSSNETYAMELHECLPLSHLT